MPTDHPEHIDLRRLREGAEQAAETGRWLELLEHARQFVEAASGASDFSFIAALLRKMGETGGRAAGLHYLRTYIARTVTVEPFLPYLFVRSALSGFYLDIRVGGYGSFVDDLMNQAGELCRFDPHLTLFFPDVEDIAGGLNEACAAADFQKVELETAHATRRLDDILSAFRQNSKSRLVVQGLLLPDQTTLGDVADANLPFSEMVAVAKINQALAATCRKVGDSVYLDQDRLAGRYGRAAWRDRRMFLSARLGVATRFFNEYAKAIVRSIRALYVPPKKVLCTDLDDTLWGGIVGEAGPAGIKTGAAGFPSNCYFVYQKYLKSLSQRGILLAIASRNNHSDVCEAFRLRARDLAVTLEDFISVKIGWQDKVSSLRSIAAELSLGLDSLVFVDDSDVECAAVRRQLPEVLVIQTPKTEPWRLVESISSRAVFDLLSVTEDDRRRAQQYRAQVSRAELENAAGSKEEFLASLHIVCAAGSGLDAPLSRTVQLINKTNQFNLTTRRYSTAEVEQFVREAGSQVVALRARDCFGDAGVVGVAICLTRDSSVYINSFLLSCRVIGRGIESVFLWYLASQARKTGATRLIGEYIPTAKNQVCADFYSRHGFHDAPPGQYGEAGGNSIFYEFDIEGGLPERPSWIVLEEESAHVHAGA